MRSPIENNVVRETRASGNGNYFSGLKGQASVLIGVFFLLPAGSPARFTDHPRKPSVAVMPGLRMFFAATSMRILHSLDAPRHGRPGARKDRSQSHVYVTVACLFTSIRDLLALCRSSHRRHFARVDSKLPRAGLMRLLRKLYFNRGHSLRAAGNASAPNILSRIS